MNRKTLQTLEICLAAVAVGYIIFAIFAYGFAPTVILDGLLFGSYALLMRTNASKAAATIAFIISGYSLWGIVALINIGINWNWGNGISDYILPIIMGAVQIAMFVLIGIAALGRVKNRRLISILIGVFGGAIVLYLVIVVITTILGGGTNNFEYTFGSLLSAAMIALIALVAMGNLSAQKQTDTDGHNSINPIEG
ncbi:MAG: hypothetical protein ACC608_06660 [Anaerofustis sp.]